MHNDLNQILNEQPGNDSPHFIIYSEQASSRLQYVAEFIFRTVLGSNFVIIHSKELFLSSPFFKINYSPEVIGKTYQVIPSGLLHEEGVPSQKPRPFFRNQKIYFYMTRESVEGGFDLFSAVFYFISRAEEWQLFKADAHGRFEASQSILFPHGYLEKPVVDIWIDEFKRSLVSFFKMKFPAKKFKVLSTIDVDNLYAYRSKGVPRTIGAAAKDLLKANGRSFMQRVRVLSGFERDPFDIYDEITAFCSERNIPLIYFFLFKTGTKFDRTVNPHSSHFKHLLQDLASKKVSTGLHPSYYSFENENMLKKEVAEFSKISGTIVQYSRQHYLRFNIKTTPDLLIKAGITTDFTMGFASAVGFRAGTGHPFYYYDFTRNQQGALRFMPFCAMDGAFTVYRKSSPGETYRKLSALSGELKKVDGIFTTVFHERTFSDHLYKGFGTLYKNLHQVLKQN